VNIAQSKAEKPGRAFTGVAEPNGSCSTTMSADHYCPVKVEKRPFELANPAISTTLCVDTNEIDCSLNPRIVNIDATIRNLYKT